MIFSILIMEERTALRTFSLFSTSVFFSKIVCAEPMKTFVEAVSKCKIYFTFYQVTFRIVLLSVMRHQCCK